MRFSGRDAILFNLRLTRDPFPIHRPFGDPGASVVQIGSKAASLGARLWVLGLANDVHLQGYRDIERGRPACAVRHATATGVK
jgi:hypothetical protein